LSGNIASTFNYFNKEKPFSQNRKAEKSKIKTTGLAGGMHHAFKAMMPAARHGL
jgi:hypothetical protein